MKFLTLFSNQILYIISYTTVSFVAICGNGIVIYLIIYFRSLSTVKNLLIFNFASTLMAALCILFTSTSNLLYHSWIFGQFMCQTVSYVQAVSVFLSAYSLICISLDRYNAIVYPLKRRCTKQHCYRFIVIIWLVALVIPLPIVVLSSVVVIDSAITDLATTQRNYQCIEDWSWVNFGYEKDNIDYKWYYSFLLMILQYILPCSVLAFTNCRIAYKVWGNQTPGEAHCCRDEKMAILKRKMIKMFFLVVITFALCWLPFNVLLILGDRYPLYNYEHIELIWFTCHCLAMSHACFNPIIYICMNSQFKNEFKHILNKCFPCVHLKSNHFNRYISSQQRIVCSHSTLNTNYIVQPTNGF